MFRTVLDYKPTAQNQERESERLTFVIYRSLTCRTRKLKCKISTLRSRRSTSQPVGKVTKTRQQVMSKSHSVLNVAKETGSVALARVLFFGISKMLR
jgi:hypothetical protein